MRVSFVQDLADIRRSVNGMAGDLQDDIRGLKTALGSGTIGIDLSDHHALTACSRHSACRSDCESKGRNPQG